ncbi:MAG: thioredoxin family protein [Planctomycetota bacterium]
MLLAVACAFSCSGLLPQLPDETFTVSMQRVVAASWREAGCAQVGRGPFVRADRDDLPDGSLQKVIEADGRAFTVALRAATAGFDALWVDGDGDDEIGDDEILDLSDRSWEGVEHVTLTDFDLPFTLTLFEHLDTRKVTVMTHYHFEGDLEVQGEEMRVFVLDMDLSGAPSMGDHWLVLDARQREFVRLPSLMFASHEMTEPWYVGDRVLRPAEGAVDGDLALTLSSPDVPRAEFMAARGARAQAELHEWFDAGRDAFLEQFEIDPDRPVDPAPPAWYHARDLTEALAYAAAEQRPLLIEFGSRGCPWCGRYSWLNYRDAAVTERLRRFALVKINRDLDPAQTAAGLGMDGVPCFALFDDEGRALHQAEGWTPPAAHVEELERTWSAWREAQAVGRASRF